MKARRMPMSFLLLHIVSCVLNSECDKESRYVDNGATDQISNRKDLTLFKTTHSVTTANGDFVHALDKGNIDVKASVNNYQPDGKFISPSKDCKLRIRGQIQPIGIRSPFDGLYKLAIRNVKPEASIDVVSSTTQKSEVLEKLKLMLAQAENTGRVIKELLSDNGGEFDNRAVRQILQQKEINQRPIMVYTFQQNPSERKNRTILKAYRTMMHDLKQFLWAELINAATHVLNGIDSTNINKKALFELWYDVASNPEELQENQNEAGENKLDLDIEVQDSFGDTIILNVKVSLLDRRKLKRNILSCTAILF
ncbi:hypothetical protein ILUMI_03245 [Ignelater luminosus]|uniref:Integrase catalytic domain-containing protein n=1 Tax=Ignelater luminosus TaxID=2038154 RepID=A0A8K0DB59_IGNLU|nr:hypothetical protein ILUMI_03245 [Ignelater luminosus]